MALPVATTWEVRTTGNDNNGGAYVAGSSGTDYSQQNAAQYSSADLTVDATTNTKVTSASHSFVAADVGNIMQITSGTNWTTGFYQIVSVASGVATLDRSPAAVSTAGGTYAVGGALASPGKVGTAIGVSITGQKVWIKAGNYMISSITANISGGPLVSPSDGYSIEGYDAARGDRTGNMPVMIAGVDSISPLIGGGASAHYTQISNIKVDGAGFTGIGGFGLGSARSIIFDCIALNCSTGFHVPSQTNCYAESCTTGFFGGSCFRCVAKLCDTGFGGSSGVYVHCVSLLHTTAGFTTGAGGYIDCINSIAYGGTGSGAGFVSNATGGMIANSIMASNVGGGYKGGFNATSMKIYNSAYYNNTNDASYDSFVTALTADPFTNSAAYDFSLNNTPGGGAALRGAGVPGTFFNFTTTTGYTDIGVAQHQDGSGPTVYSVME